MITYEAQKKLASKLNITLNSVKTDVSLEQIDSKKEKKRFRIKVAGGGCSGFQYRFLIDDQLDSDSDILFSSPELNFEIIIDKHSLPLVEGSTLDHTQSLSGEYFFLKNPNAKAKCSCGNSFST